MTGTGPHDLVVLSLESWDDIWRRNQFLVRGLLEADPELRVLFVEPSPDPLHELRSGRRFRTGTGVRTIEEVSPRLFAVELTKWLPRTVGPIANRLLRASLVRAVRRLGMERPTLWINDPGWAGLATTTGWPALYDITDDWVAARRGEREHERLVANEGLLMDVCRQVVVCSTGLAETKGRVRPVVLVPNAVDVSRFREPRPEPPDWPAGPVALYVGTLHEDRLDVDLCVAVGRRLHADGATLVLVGPNLLSADNTARLEDTPGVWLAGSRPNVEVPAYLQHAAVLVVPHIVDDFTDSLDPIKLYEYLAVGRPVVTAPVAGFRELAGQAGVTVAAGAEFVDAVARVAAAPPETELFDVPDWSERVEVMLGVLAATRG